MSTVKTRDGIPSVRGKSEGNAGIVSERELKFLSLRFVGIDPEGRYCFRFPDQPLRLIIGDSGDYREWQLAQKRYGLIDAETANAALQVRAMADRIEPGFNAREWLEARGL